MRKNIFVLAGMIVLSMAANSIAGVALTPIDKAHEIKTINNLSGGERMQAMQRYLYRLSDGQLLALMDEIGAERLLADLPAQQIEKNKNSISRSAKKVHSTPSHPRQRQLALALHDPEAKMRLCRNMANYFLNIAR